MTRYFLSSVAIEGFRGINNDGDPLILRFKNDAVNSVHGPNGLGKTSVFEAIHYAIHGNVPRLAKLQEAERGDTYVVNKFHSGQRATISLTFAADDGTPDITILVVRDAAGARQVTSPTGHPAPEQFLASLREDFVLVDYARFAQFIDDSALNRGRTFSSLVGLSRYSQLRQALDSAKNTRNMNSDFGLATLETEVTRGQQALAATRRRFLAAYTSVTGSTLTGPEEIETIKAAVSQALNSVPLLKPLLARASVMDLEFEAAEKLVEAEEGGEARKTLDGLTNTVTSLSALSVEEDDQTDIDRLLEVAKKRDEAVKRVGSASLRSLLRDALNVISGTDWTDPNVCPVCDGRSEQPLTEKLEAQIALYGEASALDDDLSREARTARGLSKLQKLEDAAPMGIAHVDRVYPGIGFKGSSISTASLNRAKDQLATLEKKRIELIEAARSQSEQIEAQLPPSLVQVTKTLSAAKQFRDAINEYETDLPKQKAAESKLERLRRWKGFITEAADVFATAESDLANKRIADIQITCQDLFSHLVRGGPDVKPMLDRSRTSENVDLRLADFFGIPNLSARALLSESYRNAVAAAIFLASAMKHSGMPRFIILDDITSSFDAGHQFSLMDAIRTQLRCGAATDGLQFIILSHDTSLEKYFDKLNGTTEWHHQKLQGMPPKGRVMVSAQQADRLKTQAQTYLNAGQVDIGAPFLRQYLEYKLGQIITKLEIPVPPDYATRGDKRTLSTYIEAILNAVDLYQAAGRCVLTAQQITNLQTHHAPGIIMNFVSHYETGAGSPFNAYALLGVLQSVDNLADCFTYTDANSQKRFYRRLDLR